MKERISVARKSIKAHITIPGSKSITNRALLLAALAEGASEITDILISDDTLAFINALRKLGVHIQLDEEEHSCIVGGCNGVFPKKDAEIWCADAGTAARFLLAACASTPGVYHFDGSEQLRVRPIAPLLRVLRMQGASITPHDADQMPFTIQGAEGLNGDSVEIDASESGQYISALLMAAPFAKQMLTIEAHNVVSRPFVEMTCAMMAEFGVMVRRIHHEKFSVPTPQRYAACDYVVEPDMTTASYFFAAAAVTGGEVMTQSVNLKKSKQGDTRFLSILEKMGCTVAETKEGLVVKGPPILQGVNVDMRDCSDTFMTLAAIAPFATTPTTITNIGHSRLQESNRITVMREQLERLKVKAEEGHDWLRIYPSKPEAAEIDPHLDHRIAMSFAIIGLRIPEIIINDSQCVAKTCPEFFKLWKQLCL